LLGRYKIGGRASILSSDGVFRGSRSLLETVPAGLPSSPIQNHPMFT
jgi:hypothetical protein